MGNHKFALAPTAFCVCVREYVCVFSNSLSVEQRSGGNLDLSWIAALRDKYGKGSMEHGENK